ncbi:MAG: DUF2490 domain-containing protein, partial [Melioribacteraceae bacterium]|nr:DUF2490 domain-containing protein [Melioribacteraceae bacterium]
MKFLILILFYFLLTSTAIAQEKNIQTWVDYTTNNWINEEWLYYGDYGIRGVLSVDDWSQYYLNPAFSYRKDVKLSYQGGLRFIYTSNLSSSNTFELRPWQGVRYVWPRFSKFYFDHYFRLEERLVWQTEVSGFDFSMRGRYRLRLRTLDFLLPLIPTKFTSAVSFEIFLDLNTVIVENYVGQNRITFALGNHV